MERHTFAMQIRNGKMNDYRTRLGEIWTELTAYLDRNKIEITVSGVQADIFLDTMRLIRQWNGKKQRKNIRQRLPGRPDSLRLWSGSPMMLTG